MDYIAFYWTLPVPWLDFNTLPTDPDEAAKVSRTIRYQVERVRRWVAEGKGRLIAERAFLELQPDRGTAEILPEVDRLIASARKHGAELVLVDFSETMGWRTHWRLRERLDASHVALYLDPVPILIDGQEMDPIAHFRAWRLAEQARAQGKGARRAEIEEVALDLRREGRSYATIATELEAAGIKTANGKTWTADNLRKFMGRH